MTAAPLAVYNEIEPYAGAWLRNLIERGHIAPGNVLVRSIAALQPEDVRHARQFHAFAGIGIWSAALRCADWPDSLAVWTGSCPCQPFSQAGARAGVEDERHLWPEWFRLISECRPGVIFGEQVAGPLVDGTAARVGRLRAYGNGIVRPQATEFVLAAKAAILEA